MSSSTYRYQAAVAAMQRAGGSYRPPNPVVNGYGDIVYGWLKYRAVK